MIKKLIALFVFSAVMANGGENITLSVSHNPDGQSCNLAADITLTADKAGDIVIMSGDASLSYPAGVKGIKECIFSLAPQGELTVSGKKLILKVSRPGKFHLRLPMLQVPVKQNGAERSVTLDFLPALSGTAQITPLRDVKYTTVFSDYKLENAISNGNNHWVWSGGKFRLSWRESSAATAENLIYAGAVNTLNITPGMLHNTGMWDFKISSGKLETQTFTVPAGWHIASVECKEAATQWSFDRTKNLLTVKLANPVKDSCRITIISRRPLNALPAKFEISGLRAEKTIPGEFQLAVSASPELRIERLSASGMFQTDNQKIKYPNLREFYTVMSDFKGEFAVSPIRPSFKEESRTVLKLRDGSIEVRFDADVEVREAPLPVLELEFDSFLQFNRIVSNQIEPQDYTIIEGGKGRKILRLKLEGKTPGKIDFSARFEADIANSKVLKLNSFTLRNARNARGNLLVTANKGVSLTDSKFSGLSPIHANMLKTGETGLLQAFIYRNEPWNISGTVALEPRHISGEVFHLVSAGNGNAYGFSLFSLHLSGAPAEKLQFKVSNRYENLDFKGAELAMVKKLDDHTYEVTFKEKQSGALTLLGSYEISRGDIPAGAMSCINAKPESVFIAVSGRSGSKSAELSKDEKVRQIEPEELPEEYRNMIGNTLLSAYRSENPENTVNVRIDNFAGTENPPLIIRNLTVNHTVDSNGSTASQAVLTVNNSSAQFLAAQLPPESRLWQLKVNNQAVRGTVSGKKLLIPLPRPERLNQNISVEFTFAQDGKALDKLSGLKIAPVLFDAHVLEMSASVKLPETVTASQESKTFVSGKMVNGNELPELVIHFDTTAVKIFKLSLWLAGAVIAGVMAIRKKKTLLAGAAFALLCGGVTLYLPGLPQITGIIAVPVIVISLIITAVRRKTGTAILLLSLTAVLNGGEVTSYLYNLNKSGDTLRLSSAMTLNLKAGDRVYLGKLYLEKFTLPDELKFQRDKSGSIQLLALDDFEGRADFNAIIPVDKKETFSLTLPPSLDGRVWADFPCKLDNAVKTGEVFRTPYSGGVFCGVIQKSVKVQTELQAKFHSAIDFRRDSTMVKINADLNIPQGETSHITLTMPSGMLLRKISAPGLNSWKFEKGRLEVFFNTPRKNEFTLHIELFSSRKALPDSFDFVTPALENASQVSSLVTVETADELQILSGTGKGVTMLNADFKKWSGNGLIQFRIIEEEPELQINEQTALRYGDGRTVITSRLTFNVSKGGIFKSRIELPAGFEILKVSGRDIADWMEKSGTLNIDFAKRITKSATVEMELARLTDRQPSQETVPAIRVVNAAKLTGNLSVSAERGTALTVVSRQGAVLSGNRTAGSNALYFQLLNPKWQAVISLDSAQPWIQAETFHNVLLRTAIAECESTVSLKIENNGIKNLMVKLPSDAQQAEFSGNRLVKATRIENNRWELSFNGRIEKNYRLTVKYKLPMDDSRTVKLTGLKIPAASSQSGYAAIHTADALELKAPQLSGEAALINARALPRKSAATPVSALRTVGSNWQALLSTAGNPGAGICKLTVDSLNLLTVMEPNGIQLNRADILFTGNGESFLAFTLPENARFWGARLHGMAAETVRDGKNRYLVPVVNGEKQPLSIVWSISADKLSKGQKGKLSGISIDAPLNNVSWQVATPNGMTLKYLGGTVEENSALLPAMGSFAPAKAKKFANIRESNIYMQSRIEQEQDISRRNDLKGELLLSNRSYNVQNLQKRQQQLLSSNIQQTAQSAAAGLNEVATQIFVQQQAIQAAAQNYDIPVNATGHTLSNRFTRALETRHNAPMLLEYRLSGSMTDFPGGLKKTLLLILTAIAVSCVVYAVKKRAK